MKKKITSLLCIIYFLACLLFSINSMAQNVMNLRTFDQEHIAFGGDKSRNVTKTFTFPEADVAIKQMTMNFTIGCPDGGCDPWDRYGDVDVLIPTGKFDSTIAVIDTLSDGTIDTIWNEPFEVMEHFEIMRFITPYGGSFSNSWTWPWTMDVSDYRPFLTGEVHLKVYIDTWVNPGWEVTIDFEMVEGTPEYEPYKIVNLWNYGHAVYGKTDQPIEEKLHPIELIVDGEADAAKVRLMNTGHGFGYTNNAAEFYPALHKLVVNGTRGNESFDQYLWWDNCSENPLSPQAGTWQFDRAGWCPGAEVPPFDYDITHLVNRGENVLLDYNADPYLNLCGSHNPDCTSEFCSGGDCSGGGNAFYIIGSHIVYYKFNPQADLDVEVISIDNVPTLGSNHVLNPSVTIRNNGTQAITNLLLLYRTDDEGFASQVWTGNLESGKRATIELPEINVFDNEEHSIEVLLNAPNGGFDENFENDGLVKNFRYGQNPVTLTFQTDDWGTETTIEIQDAEDASKVFYHEHRLQSLTAHTRTIHLPNGCYNLIVRDAAGDGLDGLVDDGTYQLVDSESNVLANISTLNFGQEDKTQFCIEGEFPAMVGIEQSTLNTYAKLYPNPSTDYTLLSLHLDKKQDIAIRIFNLSGQEIYRKDLSEIAQLQLPIQLADWAAGMYMVQVTASQNELLHERLIITK